MVFYSILKYYNIFNFLFLAGLNVIVLQRVTFKRQEFFPVLFFSILVRDIIAKY